MARVAGLEPATFRLTIGCATIAPHPNTDTRLQVDGEAGFEPAIAGPKPTVLPVTLFPSISSLHVFPTERISLTITVSTKESQVFKPVIQIVSVDMVKNNRDRLPTPFGQIALRTLPLKNTLLQQFSSKSACLEAWMKAI